VGIASGLFLWRNKTILMRKPLLISFFVFVITLFSSSCHRAVYRTASITSDSIKIGAYYFDGWTGRTFHVSPKLRDSFPERQPVWGWVTSTPDIVRQQIDMAANAGLSFFNFCWYYAKGESENVEDEILNHALSLYLKSPNRDRLQFSLLVANHEGYIIGPQEWPVAIRAWIRLFKDSSYLKLNGKPYLSFFSLSTLRKSFGSTDALRKALDELRSSARNAGLEGVTIGVAIGPDRSKMKEAKKCGFDVLTSYNDHAAGFKNNSAVEPIENLINGTGTVWKEFESAPLPYVPVATLGWDMSAWTSNIDPSSPRYEGFSPSSVYASVRSLKDWIRAHPNKTVREKAGILYAWNEYGEGSWLTPSIALKDSLLVSVKKALEAD
jgi:hypothetical protein